MKNRVLTLNLFMQHKLCFSMGLISLDTKEIKTPFFVSKSCLRRLKLMPLFQLKCVYEYTYCVHNVHNSSVVGKGGGGCLQGLPYYFPHFQKLPYSKRRSK